MANYIDKLFRDKLQHRSFSPELGDWTAMNELLDSEMGSGPTSSFSINWMFLSVACVLLSVSVYVGISRYAVDINNASHYVSLEESQIQKEKSHEIENKLTVSLSKNKLEKVVLASLLSNNQSEIIPASNITPEESKALVSNSDLANVNEDYSLRNSTLSTSSSSLNSYNKIGGNGIIPSVVIGDDNGNKRIKDLNKKERQAVLTSAIFYDDLAQEIENSALNTSSNPTNKNADTHRSDYASTSFNTPDVEQKETLFLRSQSIHHIENNSEQAELQSLSKEYPSVAKAMSTKSKRSFPLQLSIAAYGDISYVSKKLKGEDEYQSLIEIRNTQEKNIVSFGGGLEFQAKYKMLGFSTGIMLNKWGENIQYEEKYTSEWEVNSATTIDTTWSNDIIFEYDTVWSQIDSSFIYTIVDSSFVTVIDSIYITTEYDSTETVTEVGLAKQNGKSEISYWEIPLYFSYQFDLGDFYLSPGIGVTIGFLKITKGYYMGEDQLSLIPINTDYAVIRKTLFNGQINLGVGYKLGDAFSLEVTPVYKFNLSNIFENPGMIQKYSSLGVQFRIRYYFN